MNQKGISFRLNSQLTTIAIIIIASIVYINYHFSNRILIKKIEEGAINQSNLVISGIARVTVGTQEIARNVSNQVLYYYENGDVDLFLNQVLKSNEILESIHVDLYNKKDNEFKIFAACRISQTTCESDSIGTYSYFLKLNSENPKSPVGLWSNPYFCRSNPNHLLVAYKYPLFSIDGKELIGLVSCATSLNKLDKMLSDIKIGSQGYSFIIDKTGEIITHPLKEWILHKNLFEKPSLIFPENIGMIENQIKKGESGAGHGISQYLNNQKAWFYFSPLPSTDWHIIIVVPESELQKEIDLIFQKIIFVSVIGILILFLANILVFRRVLSPLVRITHAIQRFSSIPGRTRNSNDEIKMLATSLEDWQSKYGILIKEQTKTVSEKLKYEKDIQSAREIQFNIIPSGKPEFQGHPEIDLFAVLKPADSVGGDLYDYFFIDDSHLLVAIGDVSGKGIPASLFMAIASTLIKTHAKILSSSEIVSGVNEELSQRNSNQYFVTLFVGILDIETGIMDYCNAAHNFPYILNVDGSLQTLSKSHGLPLGIYKNKEYKSSSVDLHHGDMIIMYTDGVINSKDSSNQHYGTDRLEKNILNLTNLDAEEAANRLLKSILIYESEENQADDVTLLILKFLNKKETQT